ncbi:phasin family protein [Aromatoleum buckelii]|uniref:TIGR01841 family phasin n=1 Tax=Aromatoleum buckelii TaxID=200254 RepID=A0ABX1N630_9RHOO|nr:phasin family protein [Aromatoleum buckelii]MCK0509636.1 phasin family protein [Aromatoleum buckelii]
MNAIATPEQFAAASQTTIEVLTTLANAAFTQVERLTALNLNTARSAVEESVITARTMLAVKNPQDLVGLQTTTQPMLDKAVAYGRSVYEIAVDAQQEFAKLCEAQVNQRNKTFTEMLDKAAKSAPAGSEAMFAGLKLTLDAAHSMYEHVNKATKQVTEIAESNFAAVTEAALKATKTAAGASA